MKKSVCVSLLVTLLLSMMIFMTSCGGVSQSNKVSSAVNPSSTSVSVQTSTTAVSTSTSKSTSTTSETTSTSPSKDNSVSYPDKSDLTFADIAKLEFWFGSGAGAWCTTLKIKPDGTFNGHFQDSDMGDEGPDYPMGTRYECYFSGKFSPLKKQGHTHIL